MISTHLTANLLGRAEEDFSFKKQNVDNLIDEIILADNQKYMYDRGILALETEVFDQIKVVNNTFDDVSDAYNARITSDCKSDLFWRVTDFSMGTGQAGNNEFTLECTKLNSGGYELLDSDIAGNVNSGIGSTVAYVNPSGIVSYYPVNESYGNQLIDDNYLTENVNFYNDPSFGFDTRNKYGLKIYSEPYDKDIGNTLAGEFIGTCLVGSSEVVVMQEVGVGLTFGIGQILTCDKTGVIQTTPVTKIVGISTKIQDLRIIPGITTALGTVNILTLSNVVGASVSAPDDADGNFVEFSVLDDPPEFVDGGRKRYDISFDQDPFVPQTISIAKKNTLGTGVSVYLDNSGYSRNAQSWDANLKILAVSDGGLEEPNVGAGKVLYKDGFDDAPILFGGARAAEGDTRVISVASTDFGSHVLYESLNSCSTEVNNAITDALGISSTAETALIGNNSDNVELLQASQALRLQRNQIQLGIHGMRKVLSTLNEELDVLRSLQRKIKEKKVSDVVK